MMKLWCILLIFLILTITNSFVYSNEIEMKLNPANDVNEASSDLRPSLLSLMRERRYIAKRSQRNANILYRYCRQSGQARQFCLKYAVQMLYATGH